MRVVCCIVAAGACAIASRGFAAGFVIDDRSFFDGIPHTFLDFETKGDGSPVDLPFLGAERFGVEEYADFGILFDTGAAWGNFPPPSPFSGIGSALDAVGSSPTAIGGGNDWTMTFTIPVHSVGIGVVQGGWGFTGPAGDRVILKELQTRMRAFDTHGRLLGEAFFWDDLVDGGFGGPFLGGSFGEEFDQNPFGFLGIFSPDEPIASVRFTHNVDVGVIFDDLHFSALPAPGAGAAFGILALGAGLRRRRPTPTTPHSTVPRGLECVLS